MDNESLRSLVHVTGSSAWSQQFRVVLKESVLQDALGSIGGRGMQDGAAKKSLLGGKAVKEPSQDYDVSHVPADRQHFPCVLASAIGCCEMYSRVPGVFWQP